jgi:hypothetical protein
MKENKTSFLTGNLKLGDRVEILPPNQHLSHRTKRLGKITSIDGAYILVRPMWCKWEAEYYPNELKKL